MEYPVTLRHVGFVNAGGARGATDVLLYWNQSSYLYKSG